VDRGSIARHFRIISAGGADSQSRHLAEGRNWRVNIERNSRLDFNGHEHAHCARISRLSNLRGRAPSRGRRPTGARRRVDVAIDAIIATSWSMTTKRRSTVIEAARGNDTGDFSKPLFESSARPSLAPFLPALCSPSALPLYNLTDNARFTSANHDSSTDKVPSKFASIKLATLNKCDYCFVPPRKVRRG